MEYMYDSTTAGDIPAGATIVAGYVDGLYKWSPADWARFPSALHVRVAVSAGTNDGHVLDVERGDATPQQVPGWVRMRRASGLQNPIIYTSRSLVDQVVHALAVESEQASLWVADWSGVPHLVPGSVATQFADPQNGSGGHWDTSVVDSTFRPLFVAPGGPQPVPAGSPGAPWPSTSAKPVAFWGWLLTDDGAVYAGGAAVYHGGMNGSPDFVNRKAEMIYLNADGTYTIRDTAGENYVPVQ